MTTLTVLLTTVQIVRMSEDLSKVAGVEVMPVYKKIPPRRDIRFNVLCYDVKQNAFRSDDFFTVSSGFDLV